MSFIRGYLLVGLGLSKGLHNASAQEMSLREGVWSYRMTASTALSQVCPSMLIVRMNCTLRSDSATLGMTALC